MRGNNGLNLGAKMIQVASGFKCQVKRSKGTHSQLVWFGWTSGYQFIELQAKIKTHAANKNRSKTMHPSSTITISRAFSFIFKFSLSIPSLLHFSTRNLMNSPPRSLVVSAASRSPLRETFVQDTGDSFITLQEWQGWGTVSPIPAIVSQIIDDLKSLEKNINAQMSFGGNGGKLQVFHPFKLSSSYLFINLVAEVNNWKKAICICLFFRLFGAETI